MKAFPVKFLSSFVLLATLLPACKKDDNNASAVPAIPKGRCEIKASLTGAFSLNFETAISTTTAINAPGVVLTGTASSSNPQFMLVAFGPSLTTGTYNQAQALAQGIVVQFSDGNGNVWTPGQAGATGFSFTLSKRESAEVKGTFSGEIGCADLGTKITLANGSFQAAF